MKGNKIELLVGIVLIILLIIERFFVKNVVEIFLDQTYISIMLAVFTIIGFTCTFLFKDDDGDRG